MKALLWIALSIVTVPALAQVPTEAEIEQAHQICDQPGHKIPIGSVANPNPNVGQYLADWKHCDAIESEWRKRNLAAKAKAAADRDATSGVASRLKGN